VRSISPVQITALWPLEAIFSAYLRRVALGGGPELVESGLLEVARTQKAKMLFEAGYRSVQVRGCALSELVSQKWYAYYDRCSVPVTRVCSGPFRETE
jgi:hypothetical protein